MNDWDHRKSLGGGFLPPAKYAHSSKLGFFKKNTVWFLVGGMKIPRISEMFHHLDHHSIYSMFYVTLTTIHVEANNDPTIFFIMSHKKDSIPNWFASWWLNQPFEKYARQIGSFPHKSGWKKTTKTNIWSFTTQQLICESELKHPNMKSKITSIALLDFWASLAATLVGHIRVHW